MRTECWVLIWISQQDCFQFRWTWLTLLPITNAGQAWTGFMVQEAKLTFYTWWILGSVSPASSNSHSHSHSHSSNSSTNNSSTRTQNLIKGDGRFIKQTVSWSWKSRLTRPIRKPGVGAGVSLGSNSLSHRVFLELWVISVFALLNLMPLWHGPNLYLRSMGLPWWHEFELVKLEKDL